MATHNPHIRPAFQRICFVCYLCYDSNTYNIFYYSIGSINSLLAATKMCAPQDLYDASRDKWQYILAINSSADRISCPPVVRFMCVVFILFAQFFRTCYLLYYLYGARVIYAELRAPVNTGHKPQARPLTHFRACACVNVFPPSGQQCERAQACVRTLHTLVLQSNNNNKK